MEMIGRLKERWELLTPPQKRNVVIVGVVAVVVALTYVFVSSSSKPKRARAPNPKKEFQLLTGKSANTLGGNVADASLQEIRKRIARVEEFSVAAPSRKSGNTGAAGEGMTDDAISALMDDPGLGDDDKRLIADIRERRKSGGGLLKDDSGTDHKIKPTQKKSVTPDQPIRVNPDVEADAGAPTPVAQIPGGASMQPPVSIGPVKIRTFNSDTTKRNASPSGNQARKVASNGDETEGNAPKNDSNGPGDRGQAPERNVNDTATIVLPAGSILTGTLITGMDAPSANSARREPFPALLRIKSEAILPNRFRMDIRECFLIAGGYGDLSSERALLRAEAISCVRDDGSVLESTMNAFAVGEDGKVGIRGRLVSREGALIGKSLMAGFLSGVSGMLKPARVPTLSISPGQNVESQRPDADLIARESLLGGVSNATQEIAKYYIDMARTMFPIIEIDAGRRVDFIVQSGVNLAVKGGQGNVQRPQAGNGQNLWGQAISAINAQRQGNRAGSQGERSFGQQSGMIPQ